LYKLWYFSSRFGVDEGIDVSSGGVGLMADSGLIISVNGV